MRKWLFGSLIERIEQLESARALADAQQLDKRINAFELRLAKVEQSRGATLSKHLRDRFDAIESKITALELGERERIVARQTAARELPTVRPSWMDDVDWERVGTDQ